MKSNRIVVSWRTFFIVLGSWYSVRSHLKHNAREIIAKQELSKSLRNILTHEGDQSERKSVDRAIYTVSEDRLAVSAIWA